MALQFINLKTVSSPARKPGACRKSTKNTAIRTPMPGHQVERKRAPCKSEITGQRLKPGEIRSDRHFPPSAGIFPGLKRPKTVKKRQKFKIGPLCRYEDI